jgi:hypothetical protein
LLDRVVQFRFREVRGCCHGPIEMPSHGRGASTPEIKGVQGKACDKGTIRIITMFMITSVQAAICELQEEV